MIKAFEILEKFLMNKYPEELKEKSVADLLYGVLLMMCKSGESNHEIRNYIEKDESKYPEWHRCHSVKKLGKAKRLFLLAVRYRRIKIVKEIANVHSRLIG